jgi:hypothetical protein
LHSQVWVSIHKRFKKFFTSNSTYEEEKHLLRSKILNLKFKRKLSKSYGNKAAVITVPRAIARAWEQYQSIELIFDGHCLMIKPAGDDA